MLLCLCVCTIWPEILAGRYYGRLLKICHSVEFTLAIEPVLAIMIFITKWLIEHTGNLTRPCVSFGSVRTIDDEMQLKTRQIVVTLNLDCFRRVGFYSNRIYFVWITFLSLTVNPALLPPLMYNTL